MPINSTDEANKRYLIDRIESHVNKKFEGDYRKAFVDYDKDKDDALNEKELNAVLKAASVGNVLTYGSWVGGILDAFDSKTGNKDRKLNWNEFNEGIKVGG